MNQGKLVRDKIPQIIRDAEKNPITRIMGEEEYLEVLFAICEARGHLVEELMEVRNTKREKRADLSRGYSGVGMCYVIYFLNKF